MEQVEVLVSAAVTDEAIARIAAVHPRVTVVDARRWFEREPDRRLWDDERVLITPHVSGKTDLLQQRPIDLICDDPRAHVAGHPLVNVIDWERGY